MGQLRGFPLTWGPSSAPAPGIAPHVIPLTVGIPYLRGPSSQVESLEPGYLLQQLLGPQEHVHPFATKSRKRAWLATTPSFAVHSKASLADLSSDSEVPISPSHRHPHPREGFLQTSLPHTHLLCSSQEVVVGTGSVLLPLSIHHGSGQHFSFK